MRTIDTHIINPANDKLIITVHDEPGHGGAHHSYSIGWEIPARSVGHAVFEAIPNGEQIRIFFQNGPIAEHGINGGTHEALMAVIIDRLQCFQKGPYACRENAIALTKIEEALHWLQQRTITRMRRGVEGTHKV